MSWTKMTHMVRYIA